MVSVKTIIMVIVISGGAYWQWGSSRRDWLHCRSTSSWYKVSHRHNDRWWSLMVKLVILNQDSWFYLWFPTQVPCRVFFIKPEREKYREGSSLAKMMTNNDDDSDDNNYDNSDDNNHDNIDINDDNNTISSSRSLRWRLWRDCEALETLDQVTHQCHQHQY